MNNKQKKLTIDVVIFAYNAEGNVVRLLNSLLRQRETNFRINRIVLNSDSSTDQTVKLAKSIKDKRLLVAASTKRKGFANSVKEYLANVNSDLITLLNDDIVIDNQHFLDEIVKVFLKKKKLDLFVQTFLR